MIQTVKQAETFIERALREAETAGGRDRQYWHLAGAYFRGEQWARQSTSSSSTTTTTRRLQNVLDPSRPDVRVTLNLIADNTRKVDSKVTPQEIPFSIVPQEVGNPTDRILADIADTYLRVTCEEKRLLAILQTASFRRCVFGSCLLKMVLRQSDQDRDWDYAVVDPWTITLDPYLTDPDLAGGHQWLLHSYLMTVDEVRDRYGSTLEPLGEMGDLVAQQHLHYDILGRARLAAAQQSHTPAVMIHELYHGASPGEFSRLNILARTRDQRTVPLWDGQSPFTGLPFLKLDLFPRADSPWGVGIPNVCVNIQDIYNLGWTNFIRYLVHCSWIKWAAPRETLNKDTRNALRNNQMLGLIEYDRTNSGEFKAPEMVRPPDMPAAAPQMLALPPEIAMRQSGLENVSFGSISKRGEAAGTVKMRIEQADSLFSKVASTDGERYKRFLTVMLTFPVRHRGLDELRRRVGDRFSDEQLLAFLDGVDVRRPALTIDLVPGALLPKTPTEIRQEQMMYLQLGLADPGEVRYEIWRRTGSAVAYRDEQVFRLVEEENRQMRSGTPMFVEREDLHELHLPGHELCLNHPVTRFRFGDRAMELLSDHIAEHRTAIEMRRVRSLATEALAAGPAGRTGFGIAGRMDSSGEPADRVDPQGLPPEIARAMAGRSLGGRSPNPVNTARAEALGAEAAEPVGAWSGAPG